MPLSNAEKKRRSRASKGAKYHDHERETSRKRMAIYRAKNKAQKRASQLKSLLREEDQKAIEEKVVAQRQRLVSEWFGYHNLRFDMRMMRNPKMLSSFMTKIEMHKIELQVAEYEISVIENDSTFDGDDAPLPLPPLRRSAAADAVLGRATVASMRRDLRKPMKKRAPAMTPVAQTKAASARPHNNDVLSNIDIDRLISQTMAPVVTDGETSSVEAALSDVEASPTAARACVEDSPVQGVASNSALQEFLKTKFAEKSLKDAEKVRADNRAVLEAMRYLEGRGGALQYQDPHPPPLGHTQEVDLFGQSTIRGEELDSFLHPSIPQPPLFQPPAQAAPVDPFFGAPAARAAAAPTANDILRDLEREEELLRMDMSILLNDVDLAPSAFFEGNAGAPAAAAPAAAQDELLRLDMECFDIGQNGLGIEAESFGADAFAW